MHVLYRASRVIRAFLTVASSLPLTFARTVSALFPLLSQLRYSVISPVFCNDEEQQRRNGSERLTNHSLKPCCLRRLCCTNSRRTRRLYTYVYGSGVAYTGNST